MIVKLKCLAIIIFASTNLVHAYDVIPEANISSYIGEPLKVEIPTTGASGYIKLATKADYSRFGMKYIDIPLSLKVDTTNDESKVVITSNTKINSPNFEVLIEANDSGKSKFYTVPVMLDPKLENAPAGGQLIDFSEAQLPDSISKNSAKIGYNPSGRTFGPIDNRDSLWNIASVAGTKGEQQKEMVEAIRVLNPTAFVGAKLKIGVMLQIPDLASKFVVSDAVQVGENKEVLDKDTSKAVLLGPNLGLNRLASDQTEGKSLASTESDSKGLELALEKEDPRNLYVIKNIEDTQAVQPATKSNPADFSDTAAKSGAAIIPDSPALTKESIAIANNASNLELEKNSDSFVIKQINESPIVPKAAMPVSSADPSLGKEAKIGSEQLNVTKKSEEQGNPILAFVMDNLTLIIGLFISLMFLLIVIKLSKVKQMVKSESDKPNVKSNTLSSVEKLSSNALVKQNVHKEETDGSIANHDVKDVKDVKEVKEVLLQQAATRSENVEITPNSHLPKVQDLKNIDTKATSAEIQKEPYLYIDGEQGNEPAIEHIETPVELAQVIAPEIIDNMAHSSPYELLKKQEYVIKYTHSVEEALSSIKRYLGYHASISENVLAHMQRKLLNRKSKLPSHFKNMQSYAFEYAHMSHYFGINAETQSLFLKMSGIPKPVKTMILFASDVIQKSTELTDNLGSDFVEQKTVIEAEKGIPLNIEEITDQHVDIYSGFAIEDNSLGNPAIASDSELEAIVSIQTDIQIPAEASNLESDIIEEEDFVVTEKAAPLNIEEIRVQANDKITQLLDIHSEVAIEGDSLGGSAIEANSESNSESNSEAETTVSIQTDIQMPVEASNLELSIVEEQTFVETDKAELLNIEEIADQVNDKIAQRFDIQPEMATEDDQLDVTTIDSAAQTEREIIVERQAFEVIAIDEELTLQSHIIEDVDAEAESLESSVVELDGAAAIQYAEQPTVTIASEIISDTLTRELLDSDLEITSEDFSLNGEDTLEQSRAHDLFEIESNIESELLSVEEESQDAAESYEVLESAIDELAGEEIELEPEFIITEPVVVTVSEETAERESDSVKLELAEAYITIDPLKSLPLLKEILTDGSPRQKAKALELLNQLL